MNSWQQFWTPVRIFLGLGAEPQTLTFMQISLRGIIVFIFTLVMVRIGARRSLARRTVFDSIFLVILAFVLARAINGSAELLPTIGGGFAMVAFHRLLAWIAFYSHGFGNLIKGADENSNSRRRIGASKVAQQPHNQTRSRGGFAASVAR